jgi:adenylate cyclase
MGKLFEELKRRKVFKVAVVYAVVPWLLVQIVTSILPTFDAPQWVSQTIILLLVLGFPIALILAWAYEVSPEGMRSEPGLQASAQNTAPQGQRLIYATFVLVLLAVGFQIADRLPFDSEPAQLVSPVSVNSSNDQVR